MTHLPFDYEVHQEEDVVASRSLLKIYVVSILVGALGVFFAGVILAASTGALQPSLAGPKGPQRASAQLSHVEQTPIRDSERGIDLRRAQLRDLAGWGWVDRKAGIAQIPIDEAIDVVVEESSR